MVNYYSLLQVDEEASQEEIKKAYHKMVRLFHPDNFNGSKEEATEQMLKINEAYTVLSDEKKRFEYDQMIKNTNATHQQNKEKTTFHESSDNNVNTMQSSAPPVNNGQPTVNRNNSNAGCSSCLAKIIEYAIYIGIIVFVVKHFGLSDKITTVLNRLKNDKSITSVVVDKTKPESVVESYFNMLKKGNKEGINEMFTSNADNIFEGKKIKEVNDFLIDIYQNDEKNTPFYQFTEVVRNFRYEVKETKIDEDNKEACVVVNIKNIDTVLLYMSVVERETSGEIPQDASDKELKELVEKCIKRYSKECMEEMDFAIQLYEDDNGEWKINDISSPDVFFQILIGWLDQLVEAVDESNGSN